MTHPLALPAPAAEFPEAQQTLRPPSGPRILGPIPRAVRRAQRSQRRGAKTSTKRRPRVATGARIAVTSLATSAMFVIVAVMAAADSQVERPPAPAVVHQPKAVDRAPEASVLSVRIGRRLAQGATGG